MTNLAQLEAAVVEQFAGCDGCMTNRSPAAHRSIVDVIARKRPGDSLGAQLRLVDQVERCVQGDRRAREGAYWVSRLMRSSPSLRRIAAVDAPPMWAGLGCHESDTATLHQVLLTEPYRFEADVDVRWIVDAGANVGYATRWFADRFPNVTVIAVEPDP